MIWQDNEAQEKFNLWIDMAQQEPQILIQDGEVIAVLISKQLFARTKPKKHIIDALRELPLQNVDLTR